MDALLNASSLADSGGAISADYKVLCDAAGEIDVGAFTVPPPHGHDSDGKDYGSVVNAAISDGFKDQSVDYTIFFSQELKQESGANICGVGSYIQDDRPVANNPNNNPVAKPVALAMP